MSSEIGIIDASQLIRAFQEMTSDCFQARFSTMWGCPVDSKLIGPMMSFLFNFRERMSKIGFPLTDKLYREVDDDPDNRR